MIPIMNRRKIHYLVFDMDGTITQPRQAIQPIIKNYLHEFFKKHRKYCRYFLITGSNWSKILEQMVIKNTMIDKWKYSQNSTEIDLHGSLLIDFDLIFANSGNTIYSPWGVVLGGTTENLILPIPVEEYLLEAFKESLCPFKAKDFSVDGVLEYRPGMVNFSIIGRPTTQEIRDKYVQWDNETQERYKIAFDLSVNVFKLTAGGQDKDRGYNLEVSLGGQTSIDIYGKGKGKSQIIDYLGRIEPFTFFGDKTLPGGNDFSIIEELEKFHKSYQAFHVDGPKDLLWQLQSFDETLSLERYE